jgi:O-6-methylguanine DNA methyltransferase
MLAEEIGSPSAVRAVANANAMNRCAIVTPCHRVVGSDGKLTGYAGGLPRKQWLIDHEAKHARQASILQQREA